MSCPHLGRHCSLAEKRPPLLVSSCDTADLVNVNGTGTAIVDQTLTPAELFATGVGHINPSKANDPGLVYDIATDDYIPYLCGLGYSNEQVSIIAHKSVHCTSKIAQGQLNYPTFSVELGSSQTFTRTVTNVGDAEPYYNAKIVAPEGVSITVLPEKLQFTKVNEEASYSVTFSRSSNISNAFSQGYLQWVR